MASQHAHQNPDAENPSSETARPLAWLSAQRPTAVTVLLVLLFIQCLAVAVYAVNGIVELVMGKIEHLSVGISLIVFSALLAWFMWTLLRGVATQRTWVRGPAVTIQIFIVLIGVSLVQGSLWAAGLGIIVFGGVTGALFLMPRVIGFIGTRELAQD